MNNKARVNQAEQMGVAMSPDQAHKLLGGTDVISRSTFYSAIHQGQIPHLRVGRKRIIIPRVAFMRWLEAGGFVAAAGGGRAA